MHSFCRSVAAVSAVPWLVGASLMLLLPAILCAHATLLRADPAVDTRISQLPGEIRLWFSESIERRFSRITVHQARRHPATGDLQPQKQVDVGLSAGPQVTQELAVRLPETLPPGLYLVQWQVLSIDAHRTTGRFTLTYDPQAASAREAEKAKLTP
jgi:copper resistance protein C